MHKIVLKNKAPGMSTGANTELTIDGQLVKGVKSFKYEVDARGVGVVTVQYYANVNIESNVPSIVAEGVLLNDPTYQELGSITQSWTEEN